MKPKRLSNIISFVWPIIFLVPFLIIPTLSLYVDLKYFYPPKLYLLDALITGQIPLWSPAEAGGFSFWESPYNQTIYPLNLLLALFYKLTGGFSLLNYQWYSILGISLFAFSLFQWLKALKINWKIALFTTLLLVINFKVLSILNRAPATHSLAWIMCLILGLTIALNPKKSILAAITLFIGMIMLITAAYPYYLYYSLFILFPYGILLLFQKGRESIGLGEEVISIKRFLLVSIPATLIPIILCFPYLQQMQRLLGKVVSSSNKDLDQALNAYFTLSDTFSSLLLPPFSEVRGWYFMGFIPLFFILLYIIHLFYPLTKKKPSKTTFYILGGYFVFISLLSYENSIVHNIFDLLIPGFENLRAWGRVNIALLPMLAILLAQAYQTIASIWWNPQTRIENFATKKVYFLGIFTAVYACIMTIQLFIYNYGTLIPNWQKNLIDVETYTHSYSPLYYLFAGFIAFLLLTSLSYYFFNQTDKESLQKFSLPCLILFIALGAYDIGLPAAKIRAIPEAPSAQKVLVDIPAINKKAFYTKRAYNIGLSRITSTTPHSVLHGKRWYYQSYTNFMKEHGAIEGEFVMGTKRNQLKEEDRPIEIDQLLGVLDGKRLYFSKDNKSKNIQKFLDHTEKYERNSEFNVNIIEYTGDYLELEVGTKKGGFLNFIDNWDEHWQGKVNGELITIEKLFGTFKSIPIKKGISRVQLNYNPPPFSWWREFPTPNEELYKQQKQRLQQIDGVTRSLKASKKITWQEVLGTEILGDTITATAKGWGKAGASSQNKLIQAADGSVITTIQNEKQLRAIGLGNSKMAKAHAHYEFIDYAFYLTNQNIIHIYEKGIYKASLGKYQKGDRLRIDKINNEIHYRKNGWLRYSSETPVETELNVAVSMLNKGGRFGKIRASF